MARESGYAQFRVYRIVVLPSKCNKVSVACAGVPCKVSRDRPILLISACPNVNRVFASKCHEGAAKDERERILGGIRRSKYRVSNDLFIYYFLLVKLIAR